MATEALIVELKGKTGDLEKALDSTNKRLDNLDKSTKKADGSFFKLSGTASAVGKGLKTVGSVAAKASAAFLAMKAAVVATTSVAAQYGREIQNAATLTGVSVEKMQALSYATNTVGIDMDKLADSAKDTSEKVGDFLNTGGGGFMDFVDAMKLTEQQAKDVAKELQGMAGTDVLQYMVNEMEGAGVSAEQMSHALEGMASDTTNLIPLLRNGGAAMEDLKRHFYDTNVVLNQTDLSKLSELASSFDDLGSTFKATMGKFSVEYADQINSIIETTQKGLKIVGDEFASGSFTDRLDSFYTLFKANWSTVFGDNIAVMDDFAEDATDVITKIGAEYLDFSLTLPISMAIAGNKVANIFASIWDEVKIKSAEAYLILQEGLDLIGAGDVTGAKATLDAITAESVARDQAHDSEIERLKEAKDAILEKFHAEQAQATIKREQYAADSAERMLLDDAEASATVERMTGVTALIVDANREVALSEKEKAKASADAAKQKAANDKNYLNASMTLGNALFEDNKAVRAGLVVVDTAAGISRAFADLPYPAALAASASIAATGVAQLAAISSATKGGGGGSPAPVGAQANAQEPEAQPTLNISDTDQSGKGQDITIRIESDDTETARYISGILGTAKVNGSI